MCQGVDCARKQVKADTVTVDMEVVLVSVEHLLCSTMQLLLVKSAGVADAATNPHEPRTGLSSSSTVALTPLCHGMGSLQLSARLLSQMPDEVTPASTVNGDDGCSTLSPARAFSLPTGISLEAETPAFPRARTGWNHSVCEAPGDKIPKTFARCLTLCILAQWVCHTYLIK